MKSPREVLADLVVKTFRLPGFCPKWYRDLSRANQNETGRATHRFAKIVELQTTAAHSVHYGCIVYNLLTVDVNHCNCCCL